MKKIMACIMTLLFIVSSSMAETTYTVNLFGGVHFGMTSNEVAYEIQQQGYEIDHFQNDRADSWIVSPVEIGGFKDVQASYRYNVLDQLDNVRYLFEAHSVNEASKMNAEFDLIEASLIKKYGETEYTSESGKVLNLNNKVNDEEFKLWRDGKKWETCETIDYSERVVEYGDGTYMLIEHFTYADLYYFSEEPTLKHYLCYTHYREDLSKNNAAESDENLTQEEQMAKDF